MIGNNQEMILKLLLKGNQGSIRSSKVKATGSIYLKCKIEFHCHYFTHTLINTHRQTQGQTYLHINILFIYKCVCSQVSIFLNWFLLLQEFTCVSIIWNFLFTTVSNFRWLTHENKQMFTYTWMHYAQEYMKVNIHACILWNLFISCCVFKYVSF